jgi:hypothetical protein
MVNIIKIKRTFYNFIYKKQINHKVTQYKKKELIKTQGKRRYEIKKF